MTFSTCSCAALKAQIELLKAANEKLLTENQRLKVEVGTFRLLISQMRELRERELSESSETESEEEEEEDANDSESGVPDGDLNDVTHIDVDASAPEAPENSNSNEIPDCVDVEESEREPVQSSESNSNKHLDDEDGEEESESDEPSESDYREDKKCGRVQLIFNRIGAWKCSKCEKTVRGDRYRRLKHIASHMDVKLSCPFDGCNVSVAPNSLTWHITRFHKMTKTLSEFVGSELAKCIKKAKEMESEFFPPGSLEDVEVNEICKKCNTKVNSRKSQRDHIATHLNLTIRCPVTGCKKRFVAGKMYTHLARRHQLKSSEFSGKLKERWDKATKPYSGAVSKAQHDYF